MKTGRDATRSGVYISECCLTEVTLSEGQMLPRCPACLALTVWELAIQNQRPRPGLMDRRDLLKLAGGDGAVRL
jgi:hypothetical protein